jgi:hypothetical protein
MPKIALGLDAHELTILAVTIGAAAAGFWGLSKLQGAGALDEVAVINPATATPDQSTVPEGGAQSDYWSYNQAAFYSSPYGTGTTTATTTTVAGRDDGASWPGYTGPDFSSYLLTSLQNLLTGGGQSANELTNLWLGNSGSATPTNTGNPSPTGAGGTNSSPIIQVPPVAPYTPAVLAPRSPPPSPPPPPAAAPVQNLGYSQAAY